MDNSGGFNNGVWNLTHDGTLGVVLKLVDGTRRHAAVPTDTEKFLKLFKMAPHIVREFSIAFPVKIYSLRGPAGSLNQDLIIMRRASGLQLTQLLYLKFHSNEFDDLNRVFREFGEYMFTIHRIYQGMQHGDCQPSNVFYDSINGFFTLIDVADMGWPSTIPGATEGHKD